MNDLEAVDISNISVRYISEPAGDTSSERLCHDRYEILYVTSGYGKYISEGIELPISPGALFVARPFEYRAIETDGSSPYSRYTVCFLPDSLSKTAGDILERMLSADAGVFYSPGSVGTAVYSVFDRFCVSSELPEREKQAFTEALLSELIILLSASAGRHSSRTDDNLATRVSRYINANLARDLSLDTLSRRFFVNKYYLCRTFKSQSGISIHNYVNRKRVLYAKQLIDSGETASRAAYRAGFGDYSAFYRAYMKIYGISPTSSEGAGGDLNGIPFS